MAQHYPLYETLLRRISERKEEHGIDVNRMCATISDISFTLSHEDIIAHYEEIHLLILHHEILSNKGVMFSDIPYGGNLMFGASGIIYTISELPPVLLNIIAEYLENPNV